MSLGLPAAGPVGAAVILRSAARLAYESRGQKCHAIANTIDHPAALAHTWADPAVGMAFRIGRCSIGPDSTLFGVGFGKPADGDGKREDRYFGRCSTHGMAWLRWLASVTLSPGG
ncbi:hypothetical protein EJ06DRAFT_549939 [Trichodelitschia bisporula]|uniref:Uncharacterized protein n=1 Tax=Trichodelitschia bisporula TaxID=703511 RepID=A0A6G1HT85_9PEZI|nr:hypothetical protein EJ06DRAFT_549939 [Trichodelitschia bisporula]